MPKFNGGLTELPLKLGHGGVISSNKICYEKEVPKVKGCYHLSTGTIVDQYVWLWVERHQVDMRNKMNESLKWCVGLWSDNFKILSFNSLAPWRRGSNDKSIVFKLHKENGSFATHYAIAFRWIGQNVTKEKSALA